MEKIVGKGFDNWHLQHGFEVEEQITDIETFYLEKSRWDVFVLPIFNSVIMDGHPILYAGIHHD